MKRSDYAVVLNRDNPQVAERDVVVLKIDHIDNRGYAYFGPGNDGSYASRWRHPTRREYRRYLLQSQGKPMADEQAKPFPTPTEPGFYWAVRIDTEGHDRSEPRVIELYRPFPHTSLCVTGCHGIDEYRFLSGPLSLPGDTPELSLETLAGLHGQIRRLVEERNDAIKTAKEAIWSRNTACQETAQVKGVLTYAAKLRDQALAEIEVLKADRDALSTQVHHLELRIEVLRNRVEVATDAGKERILDEAVRSAPSDIVVRVANHGYRIDIHKQWIDQLGLRVRAIEDLLKVTPK